MGASPSGEKNPIGTIGLVMVFTWISPRPYFEIIQSERFPEKSGFKEYI
jgi:hypothetical protein